MIRLCLLYFLVYCFNTLHAQDIINPKFEKHLESILHNDVSSLSVEELCADTSQAYVILDARELEEYSVSHIPRAKHIGYKHFSLSNLEGISKEQPIVVYCSVGYRSENITRRLQKEGYSQVYNLIGSIFEWTNRGFPVLDKNDEVTQELHTYNKKWSKWVDHPEIIKIW